VRIGIRSRLVSAFLGMLVFPVLSAAVTGFRTEEVPVGVAIMQIVLALVIPFVICALVVGWIISKNILQPLQELRSATQHIMDGRFDIGLTYDKNDEMGDLCAAFGVMRDRLKASLERQEKLEASRRMLLASISHDLRTPMASIKGYVEGLQDGIIQDREKMIRYISVIKHKTESLDRLIETLFQYTQMDLTDPEASLRMHDSRELLESILHPFETEFADQPVRLEVGRPLPSARIRADERGIAQVFDNLIGNARRYVEDGGIIAVEAAVCGDELRISVRDTGTGIAEEDLPHVFEQFYRAEKSRSRHYGGAGLGLAICKKIVERHGGRIRAESAPNAGTTIAITLPIAKDDIARGPDGA
jgi:Signal transduction histidine kinase